MEEVDEFVGGDSMVVEEATLEEDGWDFANGGAVVGAGASEDISGVGGM